MSPKVKAALPVCVLAVAFAPKLLERHAHAALPVKGEATTHAPAPAAVADDPEMAEARQRARLRLAEFWLALRTAKSGESNFSLKIGVRSSEGHPEYVWVSQPQCEKDACVGILANQPTQTIGLAAGDRVRFQESQIADWMFMRNGKIVGNETLRPLLKSLPPDKAETYRRMLAET